MFFSFKPITPLYFVLYQNKKYIIDGLHRLNVYKNNTRFLDEKISATEVRDSLAYNRSLKKLVNEQVEYEIKRVFEQKWQKFKRS